MTQTLTRLFDSHREAVDAVRELEAMGLANIDIGLVGNNQERWHEERTFSPHDRGDAAEGAAEGGGSEGLLTGIGLLVIPGVGPVAAAGWLGSTLIGAADGGTGGLIGALTGVGVQREDAEVYTEGVRRGGTLVAVRVDDADGPRVRQVFDRFGAVDASARRALYREQGWRRFDDSGEPFTRDQIRREREMYRV